MWFSLSLPCCWKVALTAVQGCLRRPVTVCAFVSSCGQHNHRGNSCNDMRDGDLTAGLVSCHLSFPHINLNWNSRGVRRKADWATDTEEQLVWRLSIRNCAWQFGAYLWHLFRLSAGTTLCARCLAKGWFSTGNRNTSLLQREYQLVFTLQQNQNNLLNERNSGKATWARPYLHHLSGAALGALRGLTYKCPGSSLPTRCLEAPALDARELAGAPLRPLSQVAVTCTQKE